jgi:DNA-binding PadR family transcriptional regulator
MTDRAGQRSPLAMVVLALLEEAPMHPYRMHELIQERGKASVVNVAQRSSVYQTIARLVRAGLVEVHATSREEGRPERVVYRSTERGGATLRGWLEAMLATPASEYPEFPAAVSFMMLLAPREVTKHLEARHEALVEKLDGVERGKKAALAMGLPRLFLLEDEYREAMLRAEIAWLGRITRELRDGSLTWSRAWIRKVAAEAERATSRAPKKRGRN